MREPTELRVDVAEASGIDRAETAVTVFLPDAAADPPVVCFAVPGGGYSRRYYSFDLPGASGGGQAGWHTARGWVFVAIDSLGFGESTMPEPDTLVYENIAAANVRAVEHVMGLLADGALADGFPPLRDATMLGIGQSMGGCLTIVAQGQHRPFDGVGILGFSGFHTVVPSPPGAPTNPMPWLPRGSNLEQMIVLNKDVMDEAADLGFADTEALERLTATGTNPFTWAFHWDDEPKDIVDADMSAVLGGPLPPWRSPTTPACGLFMVSPGTVLAEASAITVPVLLAMGERDVVPDPWLEPKAFESARDITLFVCPRMAHMHNFASTRERFWARIHDWGTGVANQRQHR